MPVQQWIEPRQNNLIDAFLTAEKLKNYSSTNALNEAKAAELPYERERAQALNQAKIAKEAADTQKTRMEIGFQTAEWVLRDPSNKPAVIGALRHGAQFVPEMGQVAAHLEALEGPAFTETAGNLAMSVRDKINAQLNERKFAWNREQDTIDNQFQQGNLNVAQGHLGVSQANAASQIAYRGSMHGQPMVIQAPGGVYTAPRSNPQDVTRIDSIPNQAEVSETRARQKQELENQQNYRDFGANMQQLNDAVDSLDADLAEHGTETDFGIYASPEASVQSTRYADVMAAIQRVRDMGVLQPGEFPFLEMAVANPTRFMNAMRGKNIRAQLAELKAQAGRALARAGTRFQQQGGPPRISIPYGGSTPTAPTMEPGADPGVSPEQVEAEMRRRGLLR